MARTLEELAEWLETDEGKAHWKAILEQDEIEQQQEEKRKERYFSWISKKRFANKEAFIDLVHKVVAKYESKEWFEKHHYNEPKVLLDLLFDYAIKYGEPYEEGNDDYTDSYCICDFIITRAVGMGECHISVYDYTDKDKQEHAHNLFVKIQELNQRLSVEDLNDEDLRYLKDTSGNLNIDCQCELRHRDLE